MNKIFSSLLCAFSIASFAAEADYIRNFEKDVFKTDKGRNVEITFIKHATLMLDIDGYKIHVDPVTAYGTDYTQMPKADLILVSHEHFDHMDSTAINQIFTEKTKFISNGRVKEILKKSDAIQIGEVKDLKTLKIEAVPAYNITPGREQFHPKGRDVGFVLSIDNLKIYIVGDTENIPEMKNLKDIDIAFLPVNQPYTMTPAQCILATESFNPKILYPYHYGETDLTPLIEKFKKSKKTEIRVRNLQ